MSAVTFAEALCVAKGLPGTRDAVACVDALRGRYDVLSEDVPVLRRVYGSLDQSLAVMAPGAFVVRVAAADPRTLATALALVTPGVKISKKRAMRLYSDAWFALSEWVVSWNRQKIKRVA